jgi:hypothetical protein
MCHAMVTRDPPNMDQLSHPQKTTANLWFCIF